MSNSLVALLGAIASLSALVATIVFRSLSARIREVTAPKFAICPDCKGQTSEVVIVDGLLEGICAECGVISILTQWQDPVPRLTPDTQWFYTEQMWDKALASAPSCECGVQYTAMDLDTTTGEASNYKCENPDCNYREAWWDEDPQDSTYNYYDMDNHYEYMPYEVDSDLLNER